MKISIPIWPRFTFFQIILLAFIAVDVILGVWFLRNRFATKQVHSSAIAQVGAETLYQSDLNTELQLYPQQDAKARADLLNKMITDSIILQGGAADSLIKLDSSIFNASDKNYNLRVQAVDKVRQAVAAKSATVKGAVVSIWFVNTKVGPLGYDKAKQLAFQKITTLHAAVSGGRMTIEQAGDAIKNDTSLAQIDPAYQQNAIFTFAAKPTDKISFDAMFSSRMHTLDQGEVSELFTAQDVPLGQTQKIDAVFMFGKVTQKTADGGLTYRQWLDSKQALYAVTHY